MDDFFITFFSEKVNKIFAERIDDDSHNQADAERNHRAVKNAAADASEHAGTEVLRRVGCHGDSERNHRLGGQLLNAKRRGESRNGNRAERVADALDDH